MLLRSVALALPNQINHASPGTQQISLKPIPQVLDGQPGYLYGLLFENRTNLAWTTAPTRVGLNYIGKALTFFDGYRNVLQALNYNDMRNIERIQNRGHVLMPDPDTNIATTLENDFKRIFWVADPRFEPDDFAIPTAQLAARNGRFDFTAGGTADLSTGGGVVTSGTTTVNVTALIMGRNEVATPSEQEWGTVDFTSSPLVLGGEYVYADLFIAHSSTYDLFVSGDFGTVLAQTGREVLTESVHASILTGQLWATGLATQLSEVMGEPRSAGDINAKTLEPGTSNTSATLGATPADLQPIISATSWGYHEPAHITQLPYVPGEFKILFGNLSAGTKRALFHRIVRSTNDMRTSRLSTTAQTLGVAVPNNVSYVTKTKSNISFAGAKAAFLPGKLVTSGSAS